MSSEPDKIIDPDDYGFDAPDGNVRIERDRWGRPKVRSVDGEKYVWYTRCTTYIGCIEDQYQVQRWRNRMVAIGLADRPDLLLQVAAHRSPEDKQTLNGVVDAAAEAGKASAAANIGTALHKLTEKVDRGEPTGPLPPTHAPDVEAYRTVMGRLGIRAVLIEPFTVCDPLFVAGTPDRIYEVPGYGFCVGDAKSGSIEYSPLKFAMQMGVYAHSRPYDVASEQRSDYPVDVRQDVAFVVHLPQGHGVCELYEVDIAQGWEAVSVATTIREWRNRGKKLIKKLDETRLSADEASEVIDYERATLLSKAVVAAEAATTRAQLQEIWAYAVNGCGLPEDALTLICQQRLSHLEEH